ncbi:uncharacterized protein BDR25DRAFT_316191 [Lindgomyces ingoldianus]|uniref:Uncharacterized protein n=1 Tax=Lindgomyces ingoldianus TaxID=673940 RepID=A0ACB6QPL0_9PLEO|nr:uncharacterized protein BDR25DRAFT_316191 [Lindgomyces ingoldianus]KAF2468037.1 hypothetical protein BDR25DRAFT_316191 [Lindgomyces ingoldianus]
MVFLHKLRSFATLLPPTLDEDITATAPSRPICANPPIYEERPVSIKEYEEKAFDDKKNWIFRSAENRDSQYNKVPRASYFKESPFFTKLPPELREKIYRLIFSSEEPVRFQHIKGTETIMGNEDHVKHKSLKKGHSFEVVVWAGCEHTTQPFAWYFRLSSPRGYYLNSTAILAVCKGTYYEALPVLYSTNQFYFHDTYDLGVVLHKIGPGRAFIRDVHVHRFNATDSMLFDYLVPCTDIRTLRLSPWVYGIIQKTIYLGPTAERLGFDAEAYFSKFIVQKGHNFFAMIEGRSLHNNPLEVLSFSEGVCKFGHPSLLPGGRPWDENRIARFNTNLRYDLSRRAELQRERRNCLAYFIMIVTRASSPDESTAKRATKRIPNPNVGLQADAPSSSLSGSEVPELEGEDVEMGGTPSPLKKRARKRGPVMNNKAIRAREKAMVEKIDQVQSKIKNPLDKEDGVVVDCFYHVNNLAAQVGGSATKMDKNADYTHLIKLQSTNPFVLVKQVIVDEGPYAGHVAIILKQSVPFPLMKLPVSIRAKIFHHLLVHPEGAITMALKQGGTKTAYAPTYNSKNRLTILQGCRQIHEEAAPILYGQLFHFPGTQVISSFLLQCGSNRKHLKNIRSDTYNSQSARTMFHLLQEAKDFEKLSFAHVSSNEQPKTAIKNIYNDAHGWLLNLDPKKPTKGLDVMSFDHSAFHWREKDNEGNTIVKQWGPAEQVEFLKGLRIKLNQAGRKTVA